MCAWCAQPGRQHNARCYIVLECRAAATRSRRVCTSRRVMYRKVLVAGPPSYARVGGRVTGDNCFLGDVGVDPARRRAAVSILSNSPFCGARRFGPGRPCPFQHQQCIRPMWRGLVSNTMYALRFHAAFSRPENPTVYDGGDYMLYCNIFGEKNLCMLYTTSCNPPKTQRAIGIYGTYIYGYDVKSCFFFFVGRKRTEWHAPVV